MVPTALSQVFEQIVNAIVSVAAGSWLFNQAIKVEILRGESGSGYSNSWGAAGGTIGTGAGAFTALVFLLASVCRLPEDHPEEGTQGPVRLPGELWDHY